MSKCKACDIMSRESHEDTGEDVKSVSFNEDDLSSLRNSPLEEKLNDKLDEKESVSIKMCHYCRVVNKIVN